MKNKVTQSELVLRIVRKETRIVPAKRVGTPYETHWLGSEITRVCRQLVQDKLLTRLAEREDNKYTVFVPTKKLIKMWK